jgi:hypothetical protein
MYAPPAAHCASPSTARDVFADDRTRFSFAELAGDPEPIANLEFARHRAWRVMGQMKHIVDTLPFGTDVGTMAGLLRGAAQELEEAKRLLLKEESDFVGFLQNKKGVNEGWNDGAVGQDRGSVPKSSAESKL